MTSLVHVIPIPRLLFSLIPVIVTGVIFSWWSISITRISHAVLRMIIQLLMVGYFLAYIFELDKAWIILIILVIMVCISCWIALDVIPSRRLVLYKHAIVSITLGGGTVLLLITQGVLQVSPWYKPEFIIPLSGIILANSMNSISLATERLYAEIKGNTPYQKARNIAFQTALIPLVNYLLSVGIVSFPGMMTGQILSGISSLIAVRYQIMVMSMTFGSAGITTASYLILSRRLFEREISSSTKKI